MSAATSPWCSAVLCCTRRALRGAVDPSVALLMRMLLQVFAPAAAQVLAATLIARMRTVLLDSNPDSDANAGALAELLEGALAAVPPEFAEDCIVRGCGGAPAAAWRGAMGGDLFSPKVTALFQELWSHRAAALAALDKVRAPSGLRRLLRAGPELGAQFRLPSVWRR